MEKIGFIGLGIMGRPMSINLLQAGFEVTVWNRTTARMQPALDAGAIAASSPKEVAEKSDVIVAIVSDTPDAQEVILGEQGVIHGARPGSVVIDMSTISPAATRDIAAALAEKNVAMLDAPVSGGDTGAINGTLAIMVGGKEEIFQRCLPVFEAMGKTITRVGENGMGQTVKLCNQILVSVTNMAVCEAVTFAKASGLDPQIMIEAMVLEISSTALRQLGVQWDLQRGALSGGNLLSRHTTGTLRLGRIKRAKRSFRAYLKYAPRAPDAAQFRELIESL